MEHKIVHLTESDFISDGWFKLGERRKILLKCYMPTYSEVTDYTKSYSAEIIDCKLQFLYGGSEYKKIELKLSNNEWGKMPNYEMHFEDQSVKNQPLIFISTKMDELDGPYDESIALQRISSAEGLLYLIGGKSYLFKELYSHIIDYTTNNYNIRSPIIRPLSGERSYNPGIDHTAINEIGLKIKDLGTELQDRIRLSAIWINDALNDKNTTNAFLKLWISLEIICMPNTTDIRSIKTTLETIYEIKTDGENILHIGKLFGLRSKIVHEGTIKPLNYSIIMYMRDIVFDILCHIAGFSHEKRVGKWVDLPTPGIGALIRQAIK